MKITRRSFLQALVYAGAAIALPVPVAEATPTQVDDAWKKLIKDPWYFDINEYGTILVADADEPNIRREVFDISLGDKCTPEQLVQEVEGCWPLTSHFQGLASDELDEVQCQLDDDDINATERARLKHLAVVLDDDLQGWSNWVLLEGQAGLHRFEQEVRGWLDSPIEYNDLEWLPRSSGAQGQALVFFESMDSETLESLGVVIIEGEHPGSTYYGAELRQPIEDANAEAEALELPFRFKVKGAKHG